MDNSGVAPNHGKPPYDEINGVQARKSIWGYWGYSIFSNEGEGSASNSHKHTSINYFETESSIQQSMSYESNPVFFYHLPSSLMPLINGLDDEYGTMNNGWSCNYTSNQQETDTFLSDNCGNFQGSYIGMMTDEKKLGLFSKILEECSDHQLYIIVENIQTCSRLFIDAAFCKQGAASMIMLIERLRETDHAFTVTRILSTRLLEIMSHVIACVVIQHCFTSLGYQPNKILYAKVIHHCHDLAVHKVGCKSLYAAIDTISGEQRAKLLNHIANSSLSLSNDRYGNYVVQYVLSLNDQGVSARIVMNLKGHFVELSQLTGGSRIVENCMESSKYAVFIVVAEIILSPEAPLLLARNNYGNYVIQKALMKTKEHGLKVLYDALVESLRPYCTTFKQTPGLRNLVKLLKYW